MACDQGEGLDLCDLEDDYVVVEAPQTAPLVQGEVAGDVELEGAVAAVQLACSFLGQLGQDVLEAADQDLEQRATRKMAHNVILHYLLIQSSNKETNELWLCYVQTSVQ